MSSAKCRPLCPGLDVLMTNCKLCEPKIAQSSAKYSKPRHQSHFLSKMYIYHTHVHQQDWIKQCSNGNGINIFFLGIRMDVRDKLHLSSDIFMPVLLLYLSQIYNAPQSILMKYLSFTRVIFVLDGMMFEYSCKESRGFCQLKLNW